MSFLDVIKRGAGKVASGVKHAVSDQPSMQQALPELPAPEAAPSEAPPGLALPDLDPKDPDYEEKKAIHDAFTGLDKHFNENVPGVDFYKHYRGIMDDLKKAPQERHLNPLSKFAIALGTQDPEHPYAPNTGLATAQKTAENQQSEEEALFGKALGFKKEALEGHLKQLLQQGDFKKALSQSAALQDLAATQGRIKNEREGAQKIKEIEATNTGRAQVARMRADSAKTVADIRAQHATAVGKNLNLSPSDKAQQAAQIAGAKAKYLNMINDDPQTHEPASQEMIDRADEVYRKELIDIHNYFEEREIGERPSAASPRNSGTTAKPSGGMIRVKRGDGVTGSVPAANLDAWLEANPGSTKL